MTEQIGKRAIVVGASVAGLSAAQAIAPFFERVTILDRDVLPRDARQRSGVPQGKHLHVMLAGGHQALNALSPGFEAALARHGAQRIVVGRDIRVEQPTVPLFPRRDLGFVSYAASRPLIEHTLRECSLGAANLDVEQGVAVHAIVTEAGRVAGVSCKSGHASLQRLAADFVIDASGSGELTLACLKDLGLAQPEVTTIGVDVGYSTAIFEIPADFTSEWLGCMTFPQAPQSSRGALMLPTEGGRWLLGLGGRVPEQPPGDPDGFMEAVRTLRTSTLYDATRSAKRVGDIERYRFVESRHRHYERLVDFPLGLLPIGDAICRFNPIYGQGMSVAAQEALALRELLVVRRAHTDGLDGLAGAFFARSAELIQTPWQMSAIPDFVFPQTRGERPPDLEITLKAALAITRLAFEDEAVHKLQMEVAHLLKPRSAYFSGPLGARIAEHVTRALA